MGWLEKIAFDFVTGGYHECLESEARRKIILMYIVCLTGTVVLVLVGALSIFQNNPTLTGGAVTNNTFPVFVGTHH